MLFSFKIRIRVDALANATDFSDYINLLKLILPIKRYIARDLNALDQSYLAYIAFVKRPQIFDDAKQLQEADQLFNAMFDTHSPFLENRPIMM